MAACAWQAFRVEEQPSFIHSDSLQAITDARTFRRGREYARTGRVGQIQKHDGAIEAAVQGTLSYRTKLWQLDGKLRFSCSCPLGEEETCCKHVVALGLAWLGEGSPPGDQKEDPAAPDPMAELHAEDLRSHLLARDKSDLVDILLEQALGDDRLMRRLLLETSRSRGQDVEETRCAPSSTTRSARAGSSVGARWLPTPGASKMLWMPSKAC